MSLLGIKELIGFIYRQKQTCHTYDFVPRNKCEKDALQVLFLPEENGINQPDDLKKQGSSSSGNNNTDNKRREKDVTRGFPLCAVLSVIMNIKNHARLIG